MSHPRPSILPSHPPRPSAFTSNPHSAYSTTSNAHTIALQSRIAQKRAELQSLQSLHSLSATLASQMSELEEKLGTLRDGAESVSLVMGNWEGVLGVIGMVGAVAGDMTKFRAQQDDRVEEEGSKVEENVGGELPVTLVRIPVEVKREGEGGG